MIVEETFKRVCKTCSQFKIVNNLNLNEKKNVTHFIVHEKLEVSQIANFLKYLIGICILKKG
jgi:hypothetical protein